MGIRGMVKENRIVGDQRNCGQQQELWEIMESYG